MNINELKAKRNAISKRSSELAYDLVFGSVNDESAAQNKIDRLQKKVRSIDLLIERKNMINAICIERI